MNEKTPEDKIREYIWLHADEPLRKIKAGILQDYGESKSLQYISKERQAYLEEVKEVAVPSLPEVSVEDPEISKLKTEIAKFQLQKNLEVAKKELLLEKADVKDIEDLVSQRNQLSWSKKKLELDLGTARRALRRAQERVEKLKNTPCPICTRKYITHVPGGYRCNLCGSYVKKLYPRKEYV